MKLTPILSIGLLVAGCSPVQTPSAPDAATTPPPVQFTQQGRLSLDLANYASDLLPYYQRAVSACQNASGTAEDSGFAWSAWIGADGTVTASAVRLVEDGQPDQLARCVGEKLKRTRLPAPPAPAPYVSGYPAAFTWLP
jgi:hypothetical protein